MAKEFLVVTRGCLDIITGFSLHAGQLTCSADLGEVFNSHFPPNELCLLLRWCAAVGGLIDEKKNKNSYDGVRHIPDWGRIFFL